MALRPITFKEDDLNNPKKGNILPEDFSAYFSLLTGKQVGILDVLKTGTLPCTYSNIDNSVVGQTTITFNAGYISIFGRLVYIEGGTQFTFSTPVAGNGYLCLRVDLSGTGSTECEMVLIPASSGLVTNNLVENNLTGVYEFRLYDYTSTGSSVTLSNPTNEKIVNLKDYMDGANFTTQSLEDNTGSLATTKFVQDLVDKLSPKYKQLKINSTLYTKNTAQVTIDINGYGNILYDSEREKFIWQGNLRYVFQPNENKGSNYNGVGTFKIAINSIDEFSNINVINGGLFGYEVVQNVNVFPIEIGYTGIGAYEQTIDKTIIYSLEDSDFNYRATTGIQTIINVTGIILELS